MGKIVSQDELIQATAREKRAGRRVVFTNGCFDLLHPGHVRCLAEARALGEGKPVFFYMWPQYHDGTPLQFQWIDGDYWRFQLATAYAQADGIVLWSPGRYAWDVTSGWWAATTPFVRHPQAPPPRPPSAQ